MIENMDKKARIEIEIIQEKPSIIETLSNIIANIICHEYCSLEL